MQFTTAVVTDAASGIDRALATRLQSLGTALVLADIDDAALAATADELGAVAVAVGCHRSPRHAGTGRRGTDRWTGVPQRRSDG